MIAIARFLLWASAATALVGLVVVVTVLFILDPNDYKDRLERLVEERTGHPLRIDGEVGLSVLPELRLELRRLQYGDASGFNPPVLASAERVDLGIKLLPVLLRREAQIDTVFLDGLRVNLIFNESGQLNWVSARGAGDRDDPAAGDEVGAGAASSSERQPTALSAWRIEGVRLAKGAISWLDERRGRQGAVTDITVQTSVIAPGEPIEIHAVGELHGAQPAMAGHLTLEAVADLASDLRRIKLRGAELIGEAEIGEPIMDVSLAINAQADIDLAARTFQLRKLELFPRLEKDVPPSMFSGLVTVAVDGAWEQQAYRVDGLKLGGNLTHPDVPGGRTELALGANARVDLRARRLSVTEFEMEALGIALSGAFTGENFPRHPRYTGEVRVAQFDLWPFLARLGKMSPDTGDLGALDDTWLSAKFSSEPGRLTLQSIMANLGGTALEGVLSVRNLKTPRLEFDLKADTIDLDRYLPVTVEGAPRDEPAPGEGQAISGGRGEEGERTGRPDSASGEPSVIAAAGLELDGKLQIGRLKFKNLRLNDVSFPIESDDRVIRLDPVTARLYEGNYEGRLQFDTSVRPPRISVDDTLFGIQMGPLLGDLVGADYLTGVADITSSLTMRSLDRQLLRRSLNGTSRVVLREGAVKGISVPRTLQEGYRRLKGEPLAVGREPIRTDFASLSASYAITDGMAETEDLSFESPLLRVRGKGVTDLVRERLDYRLTTVLVDIPGESRYEELRVLEGVEVPIEMTGSLDRPELAVDVATLARQQAPAVIEEHQDEIRETLEREIDKHLDESTQKKAKDLLKKLF